MKFDLKKALSFPWIISVPLLLGGFVLSVFFRGTDSVLFAPAIFCLLAFAGVALYPNFKKSWSVPKTATVLFVALFWMWLVLSHFWSSIPYIATFFTVLISILPVLFLALILTPEAEKSVKIYALAIGAAICGFALWALVQFFFLYDLYGPRIHHPMLNPNNLAGVFAMGLLPSVGMFLMAKERRPLVLSALVMVLLYTALVITQSRGAFLSCAIAGFVLLVFAAWTRPVPWQKIAAVAALALAIPFSINFYGSGVLNENLMSPTDVMGLRSVLDRVTLWQSTLEMALDNVWLGTGLGSFFYYYTNYRQMSDLSDGFFAHMDPLQFWAEMGIMAPVLFYGVLICVLLQTVKAVRATGDRGLKLQIMGLFCGMLALALHTHITFHLYMPGILVPLATLMAFWYVSTEKALGGEGVRFQFQPSRKILMAGGALVLFAALLVTGWCARAAVSVHLMNRIMAQVADGKMEEASKTTDFLGHWAPDSYARYPEYKARFVIDRLWFNAKKMPPEQATALFQEATYYLNETEEKNPAHTRVWDLRARMYLALDNVIVDQGEEKAILLFRRVLNANPLAVDSRVMLANIYRSNGEQQKALALLEEGTRWPAVKGQQDINFLVAMAQLRLEMGDRDIHDRIIEEARRRAKRYGLITNGR